MQRSAQSVATPAGGSGDELEQIAGQGRIGQLSLRWHSAHIMPIIFIAIAAYLLVLGLDFPGRAGSYPTALSIGVIVLSAIQLFRQARQASIGSASIMDLGILSTGTKGAGWTGLWALAVLVIFSFLSTLVGVPYSAVVTAVITPLPLLTGKWRFIVSGVGGLLVYAFVFGFIEWLMAPLWPKPAMGACCSAIRCPGMAASSQAVIPGHSPRFLPV